MERIFDVTFSVIAIICLFPFLFPIIVILKITGEGEVFFLQKRVGKNGKVFDLFKFATMLKNSPNMATGTITIKNDSRVLPVGKFLRKTKINELPQLLNIFFGHMSIIGPRPLTTQNFRSYTKESQNSIKKVRPGLSGLGSIIFRNEEEILQGTWASKVFYDQVVAPYKGLLEEWYVANKNIYVYFLAIFVTAWVVFSPRSKIVWYVFKDLPKPPEELEKYLSYN